MKDMKETSKTSGGIGFCGLLAILFIALKLAEIGVVASWSWWWVLSPLWIPIVVFAICAILIVTLRN